MLISSRFTAIIFLSQSSFTLARIIVTLSHPLSNSLFALNLNGVQVFCFIISSFVNPFLITAGIIGMVCERLYQDLNTLAECDFLTNTLNRRAIEHQMDRKIAYCQRKNKKITLILMDIDRFKSINDNYGHDSGDLVLKVSLGVAVYGVHGQTKQELIQVADKALYCAKNSGRNRVAIAQAYD